MTMPVGMAAGCFKELDLLGPGRFGDPPKAIPILMATAAVASVTNDTRWAVLPRPGGRLLRPRPGPTCRRMYVRAVCSAVSFGHRAIQLPLADAIGVLGKRKNTSESAQW